MHPSPSRWDQTFIEIERFRRVHKSFWFHLSEMHLTAVTQFTAFRVSNVKHLLFICLPSFPNLSSYTFFWERSYERTLVRLRCQNGRPTQNHRIHRRVWAFQPRSSISDSQRWEGLLSAFSDISHIVYFLLHLPKLNVAPLIFPFLRRLVPYLFGFRLQTYRANLVRLDRAIPNRRRY